MKRIEKPAKAKKSLASATSAAILGMGIARPKGQRPSPVRVKAQWAKYHQHLLELRERLQAQMSGLAKESAEEMTN